MTPLLALQSHYLTGCLRLKSSSKCLLIDLDTPLSPLNIRKSNFEKVALI